MNTARTFGYFLLVCTLFMNASHLSAQGVLVPHNEIPDFRLPRPNVQGTYRVSQLAIDTSIKDQVARTNLTQTFVNTCGRQIEASLCFPLPYDGAIDKMTFLVDGKELTANLMDANKAREIYQGYVLKYQDPALLEWVGVGMFKTSVFPIPAGQSRTVTIKYTQLLKKDQRVTDYFFPLSTARFTSKPIDDISLRIAIQSKQKLKNIYSPTHKLDVQRDDDYNAVVRLEKKDSVPNNDFRLFYDVDKNSVGASLLSYWPDDADEGFFVMLASPEIKKQESEAVRKTVLFVVDSSGSMAGKKIEQAREAAKFVINNLNENDLFNIINYNNGVTSMSPELQRFTEDARRDAIGFVNSIYSGGGTNIDGALSAAMGMLQDDETPKYIVFLTDGKPTVGETNEVKISKNCTDQNKGRARVISFGVGHDVNSRLLDRLTRNNRGQCEYVTPDEDIETSVSRLFRKISDLILADVFVQYEFEDMDAEHGDVVNRFYPDGKFDLFTGNQMVLVGRYKSGGPAKVVMEGKVGKDSKTFVYEVKFDRKGESAKYPFAEKLWASRRIGEIIDLLDLNGQNQELVDELVLLSTKHGIMTPYTAFLADENSAVTNLTNLEARSRLALSNSLSLNEMQAGEEGFAQRSFKQNLKNLSSPMQSAEFDFEAAKDSLGGRGLAGGGGGFSGEAKGLGCRENNGIALYKRQNLVIASNAVDVDLEKSQAEIKTVKRFSKEYFDLVRDNSAMDNKAFADQKADEELLIRLRGSVYRVN